MTYPQKPILLLIALLITLPLIGCEKKTVQRLQVDTTEKPTVRARPCNVLLIGLDSLAVPMERQWAARHETPLTVTKISRKEFEESEMKVGADINVLVYPTDMMVDLIDNKRIDALGKNFYDSDEFNKFSLLKHYRKTGIRFDGQPFAATCGSPMFVQIYRDDLLNAADQTVPVTWEKLIKTQQALTDARSDDSTNAVAVPLAVGWAGNQAGLSEHLMN